MGDFIERLLQEFPCLESYRDDIKACVKERVKKEVEPFLQKKKIIKEKDRYINTLEESLKIERKKKADVEKANAAMESIQKNNAILVATVNMLTQQLKNEERNSLLMAQGGDSVYCDLVHARAEIKLLQEVIRNLQHELTPEQMDRIYKKY
jgi:hypothetical protein